jgi:hypothetical protein
MTGIPPTHRARRTTTISLILLVAILPLVPTASAQIPPAADEGRKPLEQHSAQQQTSAPLFRMETLPVGGGAEILTVFGTLNGLPPKEGDDREVPLVSILRDTLGDKDPENDRLRYVWMLTYTRPTVLQRAASAVPFLYGRVGNKKSAATEGMPPAVLDLGSPERDVWHRFMWLALQNVVFNPYGIAAKSATTSFSRNAQSYRQAHILRALAVLSLYEAETGQETAFTPDEMREIQGRLMLTDKIFGGIVDDAYLERVYQNQTAGWRDTRGHNWELLRQRAESEGLYFEPLQMPDGTATHALLWAARADLRKNGKRKFEKRFLNIADPWGDRRLERWKGYTETRYFDADNRPVSAETEGARAVEMIPLALYGLDQPKIPVLLVDFRDGGNPKRREMSHRAIEDVARTVLAVSRYGDIHYFLGRTVFDFVTARRGMDINQPTRMRAYTQLKLLLSLDASLDPALRDEIGKRLERVSLNPLENDLQAEARLAREQYAALVAYAQRDKGLAARLDRDRRSEMVPLAHGKTGRVLFRLANLLSLGTYSHRESATPEAQRATLDSSRRLAFHKKFLREVSKSGPLVEVVWNMDEVRRSLRYVAENGERADATTAGATARIFARTNDEETRRICLHCLYRINNETAKNELLRIYRAPDLDAGLRLLTAEYLRQAMREDQRIAPADARAIVSVIGQ